jgi:chaperonin GroEL (HSP60 family)
MCSLHHRVYVHTTADATVHATAAATTATAGDLATQYFADRQLFCAGRVDPEDMERISKATGGKVQSTTNGIAPGNFFCNNVKG